MKTKKLRLGLSSLVAALLLPLFAGGATGVAQAAAAPSIAATESTVDTTIDTLAVNRQLIVNTALKEVGVKPPACGKYGPCAKYDWCAMFVEWVWKQAKVSPVPTTWVARGVGKWGVQHKLFKPRPAGELGDPVPGDLVIYGPPDGVVGGHVSVVVAVDRAHGTIDTVDGNFGNKVAHRKHLVATKVTAGAKKVHISGYVKPPGA
ncbi:CHAP domain-containing protein [Amycolatopsis sp. NPDC059027]|uniref:CHAP domain-containing protein n=1 Tax=Amycolatopsis sp. NPDC059027 TaxID=3346709 RepID=UPI003672B592